MDDWTTADLVADPAWLVQALDAASDRLRLVRLEEQDYRAASFLDDRLFQTNRQVVVRPTGEVIDATGHLQRDDARWIFHIGHVGSTLLARLLGEIPGVLSVREPRALRDIALLAPERRHTVTPALRKLYSRTFEDAGLAVVKATSFVSEIAADLLSPSGAAVLMFAGPRSYMETILAGPNSLVELQHLAGYRASRAQGRLPVYPVPANEAETAALAWACEMTSLEAAADKLGGSACWLDFDALLSDMPALLAETAKFLRIDVERSVIDRVAAGPLTTRYSKDPSYAYTPRLRSELRAQARADHGMQIDHALGMLQRMAADAPLLTRALRRASLET